MLSDEELIKEAEKLYQKLGGVGNKDARIVRALWERLKEAKKQGEKQ